MKTNGVDQANMDKKDLNKDAEIQNTVPNVEASYPCRWSRQYVSGVIFSLPDNTLWNIIICIVTLIGIFVVILDVESIFVPIFEIVHNVLYAIHLFLLLSTLMSNWENTFLTWLKTFMLMNDVASYGVLFGDVALEHVVLTYTLRLHRPLIYLWQLNDYYMNCSVLGTTLKYCYIFVLSRLFWAFVWGSADNPKPAENKDNNIYIEYAGFEPFSFENFVHFFYIIDKMFIPIGPSIAMDSDVQRICCLLVMITGCLIMNGVAVASLSLVLSIYMRPEETFRARYLLIMKEMNEPSIPPSLRAKVETFYRMYWHKQKAVSETQLLPIFPPSLPAAINADIYFKATQKCRILRDLSYQFLTEVAKKMETIHYIPGDSIIKRLTKKSAIIYIAYGDIEMVTAEDDSTAMLRMIRGSILSGCAGVPAAGSGCAPVLVRAATFCTAHLLRAHHLWHLAHKYGRTNGQGAIILGSFYEHFEKVKRHYSQRVPDDSLYKSSILQFKRNLKSLKETRDASGKKLLSQTDVLLEIAGCYIMRNRADASLIDESDAICLRPTFPCILQPKSSLQIVWHTFVTSIIVAVSITHPYYLVYTSTVPLGFRIYDYMVTVIFVLDLVVHLSTGAHIEDGVPITFTQTSSQQARSQWFVLDVVAALPLFEIIGDGHFAGLNKLLKLHKVFRMLKVLEDECVYHSNFLRFLSYSLLLLLSCYLLAALQQGYMCFNLGHCQVSNFTHKPFWSEDKGKDEVFENKMIFSIYWAISMITLTLHMETWPFFRINDTLFTLFTLELCIILHVFINAMYSATITVTSALQEDYDACIENVTNFLMRDEADTMLRHRFITYLQLCWYTNKAYSITNKNKSIFHDLPSHVYQDIVARQRIKYVLCIPFMKLLPREDLKNIASNARLFYTSPNEILLNTGDISNEIYVIKQGICEILSPITKDVVGKLDVRSHFGILECLLRIPAFYTIRAATHVQILSISRKYLLDVIEIPKIKDAVEFAKEQPEYYRLQHHYEPFTFYRPPEVPPDMERFLLPRKHEPDFVFLHPFQRLGFFSVLRYIFPRFTIRPDSVYLVRFEWFRASCALLSACLFPGYTYFVLQWPSLYFITQLLDFSAYFDILQRMLVGYYNAKGILVYHPTCTAAHYLKGAFMVDLFGCLPLEFLESPWKESFDELYRIAPTKQFLMLNRLLQLYRTPSAMLGLTGFVRRDILLVIKAIPLFIAVINVLACLLVFWSADIFYSAGRSDWHIVPHTDAGGSWLTLYGKTLRFNITESPYNFHLTSFFWVVYEATTTGYGIFKPTNIEIMKILIFAMLIGALITTYYSVRIISMRANVNKSLAAFQQRMNDIAIFMKNEKLDGKLQKEVLNYYEYNWDKLGGLDYRSVFKLCDQITLRTDAILNIFGPTFTKCPVLNRCDVSLLRIIGRAVDSNYFLKGSTLVEKDDILAFVYLIDQGSVEVDVGKGKETSYVKLTRGSMFGNMEDAPTIRCPVSITTTSQVHLLKIRSKIFHSIINDFPVAKKLLDAYRPNNENYIAGVIEFSPSESKRRSTFFEPRTNFIKYLYVKNSTIQMYLIIVSLFCVYMDFYNVGFQCNHMYMLILLYGLDGGFCLKFVIQYFLPRSYDSGDLDMLYLFKSRKRYYEFDFYIDLMSCLPFELFAFLRNDPWMMFSWLRLNRILRIMTVYKTLKQHHERISINLTFTIIFTVFIWFTLLVHASTCLWYYIGALEDQAEPKSSWFYKDDGTPWCSEIKYMCSLYFVLTTFTQNGVGDILPKKQSEVVFVSLFQIMATLLYMIYLGEFSNIIQYQSFRCFKFYSKYLELQEFLKNNRVSKNLVSVVNRYTMHLWREARGAQVPYFLKTAPKYLKLKVMSATYLHHLTGNFVFRHCERAFLRQLVGCLQIYTYNEGMDVVKENEITDSMYFIHSGRIQELSGTSKTKRYHIGQYFGMLQGLVRNEPFTCSYRTITKSQVLTLHLDDLDALLEHFPISKKNIYSFVTNDDKKPDDDKKGDALDQGKGNISRERDATVRFSEKVTSIKGNSPTISTKNHTETLETPQNRSQTSSPLNLSIKPSSEYQSFGRPSKSSSVENYTSAEDTLTIDGSIELPETSILQTNTYIEQASDQNLIGPVDLEISSTESNVPSVKESATEMLKKRMSSILLNLKVDSEDFKSVEAYIEDQHGDSTSLFTSNKNKSQQSTFDKEIPSTSYEATRVTYDESVLFQQGTDDKHKTTRRTDEKNRRTLDSDMT